MEYQKIINLLGKAPNQPTKFRTKNCVEIDDKLNGVYNTGSQIRFKNSMLMSHLCVYSDVYIAVSGTIALAKLAAGRRNNNIWKLYYLKSTIWKLRKISEINNSQIDNAKDVDVVMLMYNVIQSSDNYLITWGRLWQCYRD